MAPKFPRGAVLRIKIEVEGAVLIFMRLSTATTFFARLKLALCAALSTGAIVKDVGGGANLFAGRDGRLARPAGMAFDAAGSLFVTSLTGQVKLDRPGRSCTLLEVWCYVSQPSMPRWAVGGPSWTADINRSLI